MARELEVIEIRYTKKDVEEALKKYFKLKEIYSNTGEMIFFKYHILRGKR